MQDSSAMQAPSVDLGLGVKGLSECVETVGMFVLNEGKCSV